MKNKKKKGFTLIELLAIIVILAIIAVITIPVILNIIENSKKGAIQDSAYGYKEAINKYYLTKLIDDPDYRINGTYTIDENGQMIKGNETIIIQINGQKPVGGELTYELQKITSGCLTIDGYKVIWNDNRTNRVEKGTCYEETNITFDLNYDNQTNVQTKNKDRKIGELPQPTRSGYTLEGWFTESTGGRQITADEMITGATTYYAHWTQNAVSVVFDGNGGSTPAQTIVASGSTYYDEHGSLPTPTREGYDFLGWFTQVEDGTRVYGSEILSTDVTTSVTYHAHWAEKSLISLYNSNGIRKIPTSVGDIYIGDRITIQDEGFRVIDIDNNYGVLTLLAEYNIGEEYYEDGYIPNNNGITLMTNKTYLANSGYRYKQQPGTDYHYTSFASGNYWYGREWGDPCEEGDSPQNNGDGWKYCVATNGGYAYGSQPGMKISEEEMTQGYDEVSNYLDGYEGYLNGIVYNATGNYGIYARLATYSEVWNFYNNKGTMLSNGQAYWLGSAYGEGEYGWDGVYVVNGDYTDYTDYYNYTIDYYPYRNIGIRPVIEVDANVLFQFGN